MTASVFLLSLGALRFLGSPQCPDKASIEAQLRAVAPSLLDAATHDLVMLEMREGGLQVRLFDDEGRELADRYLPGPMNCNEWAEITAALLVTWETDLAVPPDVSAPAFSALPATPPRERGSKAPEPAPLKTPVARWHGEVGVGISGSLASNGTAALGGELWAGLEPPHGAYGGELTLSGTGSRSLPLGDGSVKWQRFVAGLGGHGTLGSSTLKLQLGGAFLFGLLSVGGTGYVEPRSALAFDPGLAISGRAIWRLAPAWLTWAQLGASFWPKRQEVQVLTGTVTVYGTEVIPPVDLSLTLGISLAGDL